MTSRWEGRWCIAPSVAWTANGDDIVALDLHSPDAHPMTLDRSAASVWEELAASGPTTVTDLARAVAEAYGADTQIVRDDIVPLLADLRDAGLISRL